MRKRLTLFLNVCQVPDWTQVRAMAELNMTVKHGQTADAVVRDFRKESPLPMRSMAVGFGKSSGRWIESRRFFGARVPGNTQFRRAECLCQGECAAGVQAAGGLDAPVCRADPGRGIVRACRDPGRDLDPVPAGRRLQPTGFRSSSHGAIDFKASISSPRESS